MDKLRNILTLVLGLPIGLFLTTIISVAASSLWLIFLPWKIIDYVFSINSESLQTFEECIFACYGLAGVCTLVPLTVLGDDTND